MSENREILEKIDKLSGDFFEFKKEMRHMLTGPKGDNGIAGRTGRVEQLVKNLYDSFQEHKANHWKSMALTITGTGVVVSAIILIRG